MKKSVTNMLVSNSPVWLGPKRLIYFVFVLERREFASKLKDENIINKTLYRLDSAKVNCLFCILCKVRPPSGLYFETKITFIYYLVIV